jgi:hypothetical protein
MGPEFELHWFQCDFVKGDFGKSASGQPKYQGSDFGLK